VNPLAIVLLALEGTSAAINLAEKFITNKSIVTVLNDVNQAIGVAESILGGVHAQYVEGVHTGKYQVGDNDFGGIQAKKHA